MFDEDGITIRVTSTLKKDEVAWIRVKLEKRMNSFENYPHDPERGHDIVC